MRIHSAVLAALPLFLAADPLSSQVNRRNLRAPDVSVWVDHFTYTPGQRIRTFAQADNGAFLTVVRVSTYGDLTVLYPYRPSLQKPYRDGMFRDDEIPFSGYAGFFVSEPEGVGFVFAIASYTPFDYSTLSRKDRWTTYQLATSNQYQNRYGSRNFPNPYNLISRFIDATLPSNADYSTDYIQYQVLRDGYNQHRYLSNRDIYYHCLSAYYGQALGYCYDYALYGNPFYQPIYIARGNPATPPVTGTPDSRPKLREKMIADPVVTGQGIEKGTNPAEPPSSESKSERASAQNAWWIAQREQHRGGSGVAVDRGSGSDPQTTPLPEIYRGSIPASRVDPAPREEPQTQTRYEPMSQPRYEPPRVEPQQTPAPQMRSEPVPQPRYEPPQSAPQVMRVEPMQVPVSPPPAPPPPPPERSEPVQVAPPIHPSSPPSPAPAAERPGSVKDQ
jgi:hypothetical protein